MQGKYSPTVSQAYRENQKWWKSNCLSPLDLYDKDGYDSYGYDENDVDRAGIHENEYSSNEELYNHLLSIWSFNGVKPELNEIEMPDKLNEVKNFLKKLENDTEMMAIFKRLSNK